MPPLPSTPDWAQQTFGTVQLGDRRRTARVIRLAEAMVTRPDASLPHQVGGHAALKATYRLCAQDAVSFAALLAPHWQQTREASAAEPVVLVVQDTTRIDHSHHPMTRGLGMLEQGDGHGYFLHSALAVLPSRRVLGLLQQEPYLRQPAPVGETAMDIRTRPRETDVWRRAVAAVGPPPAHARWVHVGDRGGDFYDLLADCAASGADFLIRASRDRRVQQEQDTLTSFFPTVRALPAQEEVQLALPARHGTPARVASVRLAWTQLTLLPPQRGSTRPPLPAVSVIRVWEPTPPADTEALEWILLTSVPVHSGAEAWERVAWYTCRWVIEEYHSCLKTGCRIEARHLGSADRLWRLLGICAAVAVRLLQIRDAARMTPLLPAIRHLPVPLVQVVARLTATPSEELTTEHFFRTVAARGGHLGRTRDGPPGWKALWRGWQELHLLAEGLALASPTGQPTCG